MFDKKGVFWFLGLNFGMSWLLDVVVYLNGGLASPGFVTLMQLQMLLPAFTAILLSLFYIPGSPIYYKRDAGRGRWFYIYFLLYTLVVAIVALGNLLSPPQDTTTPAISSMLPQSLAFLGLLLLIVLRFVAGRQSMEQVWLSWGRLRYYLVFGLAYVVFFILQAALNAWFGLGSSDLAQVSATAGLKPSNLLLMSAAQALLIPIMAVVIAFGEEYGWRGYLQSELFKLGRVRGVLLLGVIWGVWHWPVILMGYNYPGHPLLGMLLFVLFSTASSIVLGYAVLKSGSVLLASYLHAFMNTVLQIIFGLGFAPFDSVFSFDIGIYGIATMAVIVLLILRDPIWRGKGSNLFQPEPEPAGMTVSEPSVPLQEAARIS